MFGVPLLKPGTIVGGKYRLRHLVADGGMAEVYAGELCVPFDKANTLFAIKRLLPDLATNPINACMFAQEASLTASLKHKNIVDCHEFIRDGGNLFIVMEFIIGKEVGALLPIIKSRPLIERTKIALSIGRGVCKALSYVHLKTDEQGTSLGIVHGDLSPQNVMVTAAGEVKLYDFGAAKMTNANFVLEEDVVRGNLRYMSPEQMAGDSIGPHSDIYSLSLVLLEMLALEDIFVNRNEASIKKANLFDPLKMTAPHRYVNDQVAAIFESGLALDIGKRFATSEDMLMALTKAESQIGSQRADRVLRGVIASAQSTVLTANAYRSRSAEAIKSLWFFLSLLAGFGFFIWLIVVIGVDLFEPKLRHNFPHWSLDPKKPKDFPDLQ